MKILLIQPPYRTAVELFNQLYPLPYGLLCIAAYVRGYGFTDITIKDFLQEQRKEYIPMPENFKGKARCYFHYGTSEQEIETWVRDNIREYDIIGVNTLQSPLYEGTKLLMKYVNKYKRKDTITIGGGPCATTTPELIINDFNYLINGEGEIPFKRLLELISIGEYPDKGIFNDKFHLVENLNDLPFPAWDLIDITNYPTYDGKIRGSLGTSRGCPWACVSGGSKIFTTKGQKSADKLKIGEKLISWNTEEEKFKTNIVANIYKSEQKNSIKLFYADSSKKGIIVTPDHLIYTKRGWVEAENLTENDEILIVEPPDIISETKKGNRNPAKKQHVKDKISKTLKEKWSGILSDRLSLSREQGKLNPINHSKKGINKKELNGNYTGNKINFRYLKRIIEKKKFNITCERCSSIKYLCVHHKDRNQDNDEFSNLEILCKRCHTKEHLPEFGDNIWKLGHIPWNKGRKK